ncbi:conserved hypothetical protein [Paenibacillus curdlanolyticus YK9]|uniref:Uncharacterized protein n=1 Tax=Paenibacillus curdlanolyticus YK9 TaxID=717606 RepID=E0I9X5_9BACL|nr:hypothetical protein [Paenibacillus curdlanolyticus]EFM10552.1 conserved hypothetical protein [Paenibacillus curdlanolyticus YK9]
MAIAADRHPLTVYLMAGVATANQMFGECCRKLEEMLSVAELDKPEIHVLYPYGDNSRSRFAQVLEVGSDLSNRIHLSRVGGRKAVEGIQRTYKGKGPVLMIGHSGGGIAAYQAAVQLHREGALPDFRLVQIGSPRIRVMPELKQRISYFHSVDAAGKLTDPISRIGTWGGWSGGKMRIPHWNAWKYAPGYVEGIEVVGGHADYFKHQNPFIDGQAVCNLDKTMERVRQWLKGWI